MWVDEHLPNLNLCQFQKKKKKNYIYYLFTKGKKNENDPGLEKLKIILTRSLSEMMEIWEALLYLYKTPFLQTEEHKETKEYSEINRSAVLI